MPKFVKKVIFSFLFFIVFFASIAPNFLIAKAATPVPKAAPVEGSWYNQSFDQWYNKVYDEKTSPGSEIFGERYTAAQVQWVVYSLMSFILNASLGNSSASQEAVACFLTSAADINNCTNTLKNLISPPSGSSPKKSDAPEQNLLQLVFADRPLSGISYVRQKISKFSLVPEAKAQSVGFGFDALKPVQDMWKASRDVSFGLFVLVAIVFAFMIMFRVKISPQIVISVQSALPKIFIALILVTFSYAIAGFLIDLMYVVIGLFSLLMPQFTPGSHMAASEAFDILTGVGIKTGSQGGLLGLIGFSVAFIISFMIALVVLVAQNVSLFVLALAIGFSTVISGGLIWLLFILILVIAAVVCIWNMIRAWWMLVKAFVSIILLTIFAPLQITLGTIIPGLGFGGWLKSFVANLATFVGTGVLMFLALIFLNQAWDKTGFSNVSGFWLHVIFGPAPVFGNNPTNISPYWPPFLGSSNGDAGIGLLFLGVSFVLFTLIPKMADIIKGFMSGKPFAYGTAIGEAFGPVGGAYSSGPVKSIREIGSARWGSRIAEKGSQLAGVVGATTVSRDLQEASDALKDKATRTQYVQTNPPGTSE